MGKTLPDIVRNILRKLKFQNRLIIVGISVVLIPFAVTGTIIYINLSSSLENIAIEKNIQIAKDTSSLIQNVLDQELKLVASIAADLQIADYMARKDYLSVKVNLESIFKKLGDDYETFFAADENGIVRADVLQEKSINIDISDREYFLRVKYGRGLPGISAPVFSKYSGKYMLVVAAPVYSGTRFTGAISIALKMNSLVRIISSARLGKTGYAFVADPAGLIIIHPEKDLILKSRITKSNNDKDSLTLIQTRRSGPSLYVDKGQKYIAGLFPLEMTGWMVIFTQTRNEIMQPAYSIMASLFLSCLLFTSLVVIMIVFLSRELGGPVQKAADIMKQVMIHSADIIVNIGVNKKILYANSAYEKISGQTADQIIGSSPVLKNTNNISEESIWHSLEGGFTWSGNVIIDHPDLTSEIISVIIMPLKNDSGKIENYLEIGRNITNELALESKLRQSQKMEAVGVMAGGIAHDFNNILSGIFGYSELALLDEKCSPEINSYVREILNSANRAKELVGQILTFSRQTELEMRPLNPKVIINEALKLIRASTPMSIEIRSNLKSTFNIVAEPTQLHQIVMNLCANAVYAMKENHGVLELSLDDFDVDDQFVELHPGLYTGPHLMLKICDTGSGIPSDKIEHIFNPFYTTKPKGEGTGLGLSVVHGIVRKMNGIITVYSDMGKGTVFNIILPAAIETKEDKAETVSVLHGGTERILLVDDEKPIVTAMKAILTGLGYNISIFYDSVEAIDAFRKNPDGYDLVVTDYSMPKITGLELVREIFSIRRDMPAILITGYLNNSMEASCREAGISEIIKKPFSTYQIADAIRKILD